MSPRISVITSTPPGFNPGMIATELGLTAFLRRHGWLDKTDFFQLVSWRDRLASLPPPERSLLESRGYTGIDHRAAPAHYEAIAGSDVVLLWADFLHMAEHIRQMRDVVSALLASRGERADANLVERFFLLSEADDATLRRTISFGTTLLFNTLRGELDPSYAIPLSRLLRRAKRVWVRDAMSAARVAHLRRDYQTGYFGVDGALLLERSDVIRGAAAAGSRAAAGSGSVLVFFGRDAAESPALTDLARGLAAATGRPLHWLPWGDRGAFPALCASTVPSSLPEDLTIHELLNEVAHASLVVTDTYHLAVTAWNFGVPAVASFPGHTTADVDVSSGARFNWRDKREMFFSQYDALDFLVRPEELADAAAMRRRAGRIVEALGDASLRSAIVANIRTHAASVEADLAAAVADLLAKATTNRTNRWRNRGFRPGIVWRHGVADRS